MACVPVSHTHRYALTLRPPLDKTSYSTMSNPEVNVIRLTCKLNWEQGRLTLFLSSAGTSRPTLLWQLCIRMWRGGSRGSPGQERTDLLRVTQNNLYCWISLKSHILLFHSLTHTGGKTFYCYLIWTLQSIYWLLLSIKGHWMMKSTQLKICIKCIN